MKLTIERLLYVAIGITLVFFVSGCKEGATDSSSVSLPTVAPVSPSQPPPVNNIPNNTPPSPPPPSTDMVYNVNWDTTYNAEGVSVTLQAHASNNANFKRIDIYSDDSCLNLVNIVTPANLVSNAVTWSIPQNVISYVSVIETDIYDSVSSCKNISATQMDSDTIAPSAPSNFQVNYSWSNATTLAFTTQWSAATDNVSVVRYYIYVSTDPNSYANPLASTSTTGLSRNFSFTITDSNMFYGSSVFLHIVAEDQDGNLSQAITDSGYYIDTVAPSLGANVAYLNRGLTGIAINISGTCEVGIPVSLTYSGNMSAFSGLLASTTSCDNGTFTYTFPVLFAWYVDNMVITAHQTDANSNVTDFPVNLVSSATLPSVIQ